MRLVVVSGRSGSGKSAALGSLEDAGYTCIDNLPVSVVLPTLLVIKGRTPDAQVAIGIDARSRAEDLDSLPAVLNRLNEQGIEGRVVWLDASMDALVARFHATRRRHPLLRDSGSLEQALRNEETLLKPIMDLADRHLDTSAMSVHELRSSILTLADPNYQAPPSAIHLMSFGFKFGSPTTIDYLMDARFLPNPYWDPALRSLNGQDQPVIDYLERQPDTREYLADLESLIRRWSPTICASGRPSVTVAIGCTGGQHRSVYLVETLAKRLADDFDVSCSHREMRA